MKLLDNIIQVDDAKTLSFKLVGNDRNFNEEYLVFIKEQLTNHNICRLLLHGSQQSDLHSMVIAMQNSKYILPHKHLKSESYQIIDGEILIIFFEEDGSIKQFSHLDKANNIVVLVEPNQYHSIIVLSKTAIFTETRVGPFEKKNDSFFPSWIESDNEQYINNILNLYKEF
jgi:cupin fold WbuC family metalloprotein